MVQTRNAAKRQKTEECWNRCFSTVTGIACYLPADSLLNLAFTCRRFGFGGDDNFSLVEETARRVVHDAATEEEMAALPCHDRDYNWLYKYNYLQLLRTHLTFDQLIGPIGYVEENKSRVTTHDTSSGWATAFSNNIMMAGKHYVSFEVSDVDGHYNDVLLGVMRPGEAMQSTMNDPMSRTFYERFTQREGSIRYNNRVNCCMYSTLQGCCESSAWEERYHLHDSVREDWDGMEEASEGSIEVEMLLDLDEGTLSVYKNGRKLGVMKRGLAGQYCWVVAMLAGTWVTIKRGTVPAS